MKVISGHQPVYLPWIGLFHKFHLCDEFVYMDTVQYLKQDWNNRNKIRTPHGSFMLIVPIDKKKSGSNLDEIYLKTGDLDDKNFWQNQHLTNIKANYSKTPFFRELFPELENIYLNTIWEKLNDLCWAQFQLFVKFLGMEDKPIVKMSEVEFSGYKDELVLDHCLKLDGDHVVFGTHGRDYVDLDKFHSHGIKVYFQNYNHPVYRQKFEPFEPYMSAIDLFFNHGKVKSREFLLKDNITYTDLRNSTQHWK
jgi:hypothetical protein